MSTDTDDKTFDQVLVTSAMRLAAERGWPRMNLRDAARAADLPLARTRERFPNRAVVLQRLGQMMDSAALTDVPADGIVRDALFDMLLRRFDVLQVHRPGVLAVLDALPFDPPAAVMLACGTRQSMRWMLDAVGIDTAGIRGELRVKGLLGVWLWAARAWRTDTSPDLSATMVAVDNALSRAEEFAGWLGGQSEAVTTSAVPLDAGPESANDSAPPAEPDPSQPI